MATESLRNRILELFPDPESFKTDHEKYAYVSGLTAAVSLLDKEPRIEWVKFWKEPPPKIMAWYAVKTLSGFQGHIEFDFEKKRFRVAGTISDWAENYPTLFWLKETGPVKLSEIGGAE